MPSWQYDEAIPVGGDFSRGEVVEAYDAFHRRFRDVDKENAAIIAGLDLQEDQVLVDVGCGTGVFAVQAARRCARVHAVDVSAAMLDYTQRKAQSQGLTNVICHHGGFLTYVHTDGPVDAVTTSMALHHLPDFWKQKALARLNAMLRKGGRIFLAEVRPTWSPRRRQGPCGHWVWRWSEISRRGDIMSRLRPNRTTRRTSPRQARVGLSSQGTVRWLSLRIPLAWNWTGSRRRPTPPRRSRTWSLYRSGETAHTTSLWVGRIRSG